METVQMVACDLSIIIRSSQFPEAHVFLQKVLHIFTNLVSNFFLSWAPEDMTGQLISMTVGYTSMYNTEVWRHG